MAVELVSITHNTAEYSAPTPNKDFLIGSIGDKIRTTLIFDFYWATENVNMTFVAATSTITRNDAGSFIDDEFKIGDTIRISGTTFNNIVTFISDITDSVITVVGFLVNETTFCTIAGETPITNIDYFYNLIENDAPESFKSLTDRDTVQRWNAQGCDASGMLLQNMVAASNSQAWVNGTATIDDVSFVNSRQRFVVIHEYFITPLFLANQLSNIQNGIPPSPDYYADRFTLKYAAKIDGRFYAYRPDIDHTSDFSLRRGNVGWFGEFLDGFTPEYSLLSITPTTAAAWCGSTSFDIRIASANGSFNAGDELVLNMLYLPLDESDYIDTPTNFIDDFRFDRILLTEGAAPANGEQFGTQNQCITNAEANLIGATEMQVQFDANLSGNLQTFIAGKPAGNRYYLIWVTAQRSTLVPGTQFTDRNAVICAVDEYVCDLDDAGALSIQGGNIDFHQFPDEVSNPRDHAIVSLAEPVYTRTRFQIDIADNLLQDVTVAIEARHATDGAVLLEETIFDTRQFVKDCDGIQQIDIDKGRDFREAADSFYNRALLKRLPALDGAGQAGYELQYGFLIRYENWRLALIENDCFTQDEGENWYEYLLRAGWTIRMRITWNIQNLTNEHVTTFNQLATLDIRNFNTTGDIVATIDIQTWDETESGLLNGNILVDENTLIVATFTGAFAALPLGSTGYIAMIQLDNLSVGGTSFRWQIDTLNLARHEDSPLSGYPILAGLPSLTIVNPTTIQVRALIDYTKLPLGITDAWTIRARLGTRNEENLLLQENLDLLLQENGDGILIT